MLPVRADPQNWNFRTIFAQTVAMGSARHLASPHVVLPFLFVAAGGPVLAAALIVPVVEICRLVGSAGAAPVVRSAATVKWHLALVLGVIAAGLTVIGLTAQTHPGAGLALVFLGAAAVIGLGMSASILAHQDLLGRLLPEAARARLMYGEAIFAGALAIAIAAGSHYVFGDDVPLDRHLSLLWASVFILLVSAVLIAVVREDARDPAAASATSGEDATRSWTFKTFGADMARVVKIPWARKYIVARLLFLSVELALPFYAIHAAIHHKHVAAGLTVVLIASSAAMILAGLLWRAVVLPHRTVMVIGTVFAAAGGLLVLAIDFIPGLQLLILHGVVLFLVAFGAISIVSARSLYVIDMAPGRDRPTIIAVASVITGAVAILAAFVLGLIAQEHSLRWPIVVLIAATVAAGLWAAWLPPALHCSGRKDHEEIYSHEVS